MKQESTYQLIWVLNPTDDWSYHRVWQVSNVDDALDVVHTGTNCHLNQSISHDWLYTVKVEGNPELGVRRVWKCRVPGLGCSRTMGFEVSLAGQGSNLCKI